MRINIGLNALFGRLGATMNWRRLSDEYFADAPPCTHLGELAWAYREERNLQRL